MGRVLPRLAKRSLDWIQGVATRLKAFNMEAYVRDCEKFQMPDKRCTFPFMDPEHEYCWDYADFKEGNLRDHRRVLTRREDFIRVKCLRCQWWKEKRCKSE